MAHHKHETRQERMSRDLFYIRRKAVTRWLTVMPSYWDNWNYNPTSVPIMTYPLFLMHLILL